jgi:hypothetical protein
MGGKLTLVDGVLPALREQYSCDDHWLQSSYDKRQGGCSSVVIDEQCKDCRRDYAEEV